jgi:hypothetical protein
MATRDDADRETVAIRVALAGLPAPLRHSLEQDVARRAEMSMVRVDAGPSTERVDLLLAVAQGVDVLVLGTRDAASPPGVCDHLLGEFPALMILLVSHGGDLATLHWLGPRRYRVRRVSADSLVRVARLALASRTSQRTAAAQHGR